MASFPWLTVITFLPAAVGLVVACVPDPKGALAKRAALIVSLVVAALSFLLWAGFKPVDGMQFVENRLWIPALNVRYHLAVDGVSLAMIVLTAVLMPMAIQASWTSIHERGKEFFVSMLFLETGMLGVFAAGDLFLFYVFWEAMLIPMYLIIGIWGGPRRVYAAVKFVVYTIFGSLLMFGAIVYCYIASHEFADRGTFEIAALQENLRLVRGVTGTAQALLFLAFGISFAIKVPMFPFHTWLPDAHVEAPTAGSVVLAGVLLKMGAYGFFRLAVPFFPEAAQRFTPMMIALSVIGIVYGALMALAQSDIKKLIAYSSVSHLGFVMLGLFAGTVEAAQGAILQMVNHGVSTGALFLLVGFLYEKTHRRGVDDFGGLAKVTPAYAAIFLIVSLSSMGLPGTNGFVGEFLVLLGTFQRYPVPCAVSALGVILGALYLLRVYRALFFGEVTAPKLEKISDVTWAELSYLVPLVFLIFAIGIQPNFILNRTQRAAEAYVKVLTKVRP